MSGTRFKLYLDITSMSIEEPPNWAFVANLRNLQANAIEVADGHVLRRASSEEISEIKEITKQFGFVYSRLPGALWEHPWPGGGNLLPVSEWRYFVIEFRGNNQILEELKSAFDLSPVELEVGFQVIHHIIGQAPLRGMGLHPVRLFHLLDNAQFRDNFFVDFSAVDADFTKRVLQRLHELPQSDPLRRLLRQLGELKGLPYVSSLRFLGYFALLESMLTHSPKPEDPYDSITRQVKKKLALLNHRWSMQIDYAPFGGADPESIWTRMYAYRSAVAHEATRTLLKTSNCSKTPKLRYILSRRQQRPSCGIA
jgi:hypothetical protein